MDEIPYFTSRNFQISSESISGEYGNHVYPALDICLTNTRPAKREILVNLPKVEQMTRGRLVKREISRNFGKKVIRLREEISNIRGK